jgi:hypothetical protein
MMRRTIAWAVLLAAVHLGAAPVVAQTAAGPAGHWEGAIHVPGQELAIAVDLFAHQDQTWDGAISIPAQNIKAMPLAEVTVQGDTVGFAMKGVPGDPRFKGTLASDRKSMTGAFTQGGAELTFALAWKGEATRAAPAKSTAISQDLEGSWEGAVEVNGTRLRLVFRLANREGQATGTVVSVDQGGVEIPITTIVQTGSHLRLDISTVGAAYEGDLKEGQLTGTWTQGPATLPLTLKRAAP